MFRNLIPALADRYHVIAPDYPGYGQSDIRWNHPFRGTISPTEFIPIAEETGLICQLGDWALATACAEAANWQPSIKLAVNVSPVQFRSHAFSLKVAICWRQPAY
jgi:EAL domain-containing protein (putative c-di-GMP-specific phosphodiesterase class I)